VILAVAVSCVIQVIAAVGVERDHSQAVCEHFVREDGGVAFDFDDVQGQGGHFSEDHAAEGVGKCEVHGAESEVNAEGLGLGVSQLGFFWYFIYGSTYFTDSHLGPCGL
jgi:hypothetical protein